MYSVRFYRDTKYFNRTGFDGYGIIFVIFFFFFTNRIVHQTTHVQTNFKIFTLAVFKKTKNYFYFVFFFNKFTAIMIFFIRDNGTEISIRFERKLNFPTGSKCPQRISLTSTATFRSG